LTAPLPLADHGSIVTAIPFVVPMVVIVAGLIVLMARDRLSRHR
jgi:choline-glycine betaine transporter